MLIRKIPHYDFGNPCFSPLNNAEFLKSAFYLSFPPLPTVYPAEKALLSIPGALEVRVICRSCDDETPDRDSIRGEGCFQFNRDREWILEAACTMETPERGKQDTYLIRLPLSAPFAKDGRIGLWFDGTWLRFMKDGELLNENAGLDNFCTPTGEPFIDADMEGVEVAEIAGRRTLISLRPEFFPTRVSLLADANLTAGASCLKQIPCAEF